MANNSVYVRDSEIDRLLLSDDEDLSELHADSFGCSQDFGGTGEDDWDAIVNIGDEDVSDNHDDDVSEPDFDVGLSESQANMTVVNDNILSHNSPENNVNEVRNQIIDNVNIDMIDIEHNDALTDDYSKLYHKKSTLIWDESQGRNTLHQSIMILPKYRHTSWRQ